MSPGSATANEVALTQPVILSISGISQGNRGPAAAGVVLFHPEGRIYLKCYRYLGPGTSNTAAYEALLLGLRAALQHGFCQVVIRSSSELMINQLTGAYAVKDPTLQALHAIGQALLRHFGSWQAAYAPRAETARAHRLAEKAIALREQHA